ncbi:CASP-like protein 1D1 [Striga hermonthica]|uniref:CASP-like protein n=1 Tax=Striga hermonthica TaxID=68872 RepID=A0A9N7NPD2_STRHE|nr:CASP-like protein 1D1 [Striga hermonthica]
MASATGAAGTVGYIGLKGNSNVQWRKICDLYDGFCRHVGASIAVSLFGSVVLTLLIIISVRALSKRIPNLLFSGAFRTAMLPPSTGSCSLTSVAMWSSQPGSISTCKWLASPCSRAVPAASFDYRLVVVGVKVGFFSVLPSTPSHFSRLPWCWVVGLASGYGLAPISCRLVAAG